MASRTYRVWPDGIVQDVEDGEAYPWMSDDYILIDAVDEEDALRVATQGWSRA